MEITTKLNRTVITMKLDTTNPTTLPTTNALLAAQLRRIVCDLDSQVRVQFKRYAAGEQTVPKRRRIDDDFIAALPQDAVADRHFALADATIDFPDVTVRGDVIFFIAKYTCYLDYDPIRKPSTRRKRIKGAPQEVHFRISGSYDVYESTAGVSGITLTQWI